MLQESLLCGCGAPLAHGPFCVRCERRDRLNREYFGGLREAALRRDGYRCQVCREEDPLLVLVHHRRPGVDALELLLTLCRRCHAKIHFTRRPSFWFATFSPLRRLWREANPNVQEQRLLALAAEVRAYEQTALAFDDKGDV